MKPVAGAWLASALMCLTIAATAAGQQNTPVPPAARPETSGRTDALPPVARHIESQPQLAARINALLQGSGMTLADAAAGFTNEGIFIVALHVSRNERGMPFAALRREMIDGRLPLDRAIARLNRSVDVTAAVTLAQRQAELDMLADSAPPGSAPASAKRATPRPPRAK